MKRPKPSLRSARLKSIFNIKNFSSSTSAQINNFSVKLRNRSSPIRFLKQIKQLSSQFCFDDRQASSRWRSQERGKYVLIFIISLFSSSSQFYLYLISFYYCSDLSIVGEKGKKRKGKGIRKTFVSFMRFIFDFHCLKYQKEIMMNS